MAANWNNPALASLYTDFLTQLKERDVDTLTMTPGINLPVGAKRWNAPTNTFQNWDGAVWNNLVLGAAGGGTGVITPPPALGTMAAQNSNAVAITGGSMTGVALNAGDISSGILALARGGTGASLALGANGSFLQSNGAQVVFGVNGAALTGLNASNISAGNLAIARMPTGGTWALTSLMEITSPSYIRFQGSGFIVGPIGDMGAGTINAQAIYINGVPLATGAGIPSGMLAMFELACPAGWTVVNDANGRFLKFGGLANGNRGGNNTHTHQVQVAESKSTGASDAPQTLQTPMGGINRSFDAGGSFSGFLPDNNFNHVHGMAHMHNFNFDITVTSGGNSEEPAYIEYFLCRKN